MLLPAKSQLITAIQLQKDTARREVVCYNYPINREKKGPDFTLVLIFLITSTKRYHANNIVSNMIPGDQENSKNNCNFFEV